MPSSHCSISGTLFIVLCALGHVWFMQVLNVHFTGAVSTHYFHQHKVCLLTCQLLLEHWIYRLHQIYCYCPPILLPLWRYDISYIGFQLNFFTSLVFWTQWSYVANRGRFPWHFDLANVNDWKMVLRMVSQIRSEHYLVCYIHNKFSFFSWMWRWCKQSVHWILLIHWNAHLWRDCVLCVLS